MALEKKVTIAGEEVTFKVDGSLPPRYRMQFQKDYFADILTIVSAMSVVGGNVAEQDFSKLDTMPIYNVIYLMAKTADSTISDMFDWLASFDEFPIFDVFMELEGLLMANMQTQVNKIKKK